MHTYSHTHSYVRTELGGVAQDLSCAKVVHLLYHKASKLNKQINRNAKTIENCPVQETGPLVNPPSWAGSTFTQEGPSGGPQLK